MVDNWWKELTDFLVKTMGKWMLFAAFAVAAGLAATIFGFGIRETWMIVVMCISFFLFVSTAAYWVVSRLRALEKEREDTESRDHYLALEFGKLDFYLQEIIFRIYRDGSVDIKGKLFQDDTYDYREAKYQLAKYIDYSVTVDGERHTLQPWAQQFFDRNPNAIEDARRSVERESEDPSET